MSPAWRLRSFAHRPPAAAAGTLPNRLPAVIGHLRLSFVLGVAAMLLCWFAGMFREAAGDHGFLRIWGNESANLWPGPFLIGAGAFAVLALPAIWPLLADQRLIGKLRNLRLLPRKLFGPLLHWSVSLTLSITMATAVCLCLLYFECENETKCHQVESLTLPIAYQACQGAPPKPRVVVNVLQDGAIRINGLVHTREEMHAVLASEADRHRMADGWSALSVYVRADADVPAKHVHVVLEACRRAKAHRVSFGVSPEDAGRTVAPRTE